MLALARRPDESVVVTVGEVRFSLMVASVRGDKVILAFDAPPEVVIHRSEVQAKVDAGRTATEAINEVKT